MGHKECMRENERDTSSMILMLSCDKEIIINTHHTVMYSQKGPLSTKSHFLILQLRFQGPQEDSGAFAQWKSEEG